MLRRIIRPRPWLIVTGGCLIVIVIIMDAGRRTEEFQKHRLKYSMPTNVSTINLVKQNEK